MVDLLKFRVFGRPAASRSYPLAVQVLTLIGFGLVIAGGLAAPHVSAKLTGTLRNTNLAALFVWSLWWPLVIVSAVLAGRVWCQVCPMELVNSLVGKFGLKRRVPRVLASGWGIAVFYALALLGFIRTFWANRYPERMAYFFLFLFAAAVLAGVVFEKRAFCDYLCPVGRLLGLYACCSPLEWRVRDGETCEACRTKDCVAARNAHRLTRRGCTSNLYPAAIRDNRDCLVCTQCRKVCPSDNLRLSLRPPMADLSRVFRLGSVDFFLLFAVAGLVVWELAEEWSPARAALEFIPAKFSGWLGASGEAANFVQAVFLLILLPGVLFMIPGLMGRWLNRSTLRESAMSFGVLILPVVALGHSVKALIRMVSRLPYHAQAFKDPVGDSTANLISSGTLKVNMRIADVLSPWVTGIVLITFAVALLSVWAVGLRRHADSGFGRAGEMSHIIIATIYGAALLLIVVFARI